MSVCICLFVYLSRRLIFLPMFRALCDEPWLLPGQHFLCPAFVSFSLFSTSHSCTLLFLQPDTDFSWRNPYSWEHACFILFKKALSYFSELMDCICLSLKDIFVGSHHILLTYSPPGSCLQFSSTMWQPCIFYFSYFLGFPQELLNTCFFLAPCSPSPFTPAQARLHLVPMCLILPSNKKINRAHFPNCPQLLFCSSWDWNLKCDPHPSCLLTTAFHGKVVRHPLSRRRNRCLSWKSLPHTLFICLLLEGLGMSKA